MCSIIYNCCRLLTDKLESVQRNAALVCTRAFRRTPTTTLLAELGWLTLETRRQYFRLVMLYKMKNNTPDCLQSILSPLQGQYANRPSRHAHNFTAPRTRGQKHHQSLVPQTIRQWNALDDDMKNLPSTNSFKRNVKKKRFPTKMQLYCKGTGRSAMNHTRMRVYLNHLRQHLHSFGIISNPHCLNCPGRLEAVSHYLLHCSRYTRIRHKMMTKLWWRLTAYV